jgi:hypothetical protein
LDDRPLDFAWWRWLQPRDVSNLIRILFLALCVGMMVETYCPLLIAADTDNVVIDQTSTATTKFGNFQNYFKNWAVILILIALVVAAIFAAIGRYSWIIGVAVACILIFGGSYIVGMFQQGLK